MVTFVVSFGIKEPIVLNDSEDTVNPLASPVMGVAPDLVMKSHNLESGINLHIFSILEPNSPLLDLFFLVYCCPLTLSVNKFI